MTLSETDQAALFADSLAFRDVVDRLHDEGLTDGLPVMPPTAARVQTMLAGRNPSTPVAVVPPLSRPADLRAVAICAVMAGCRPPDLDVLVAAVQALAAPELNLIGVATTTGNTAVGLVLHGEIVGRLRANPDANTLGPGNRTNASLGRALALAIRLLGGATPGSVDMSTIGQSAKFGCCFAETAPIDPWEGFASRRGVHAASAVTVFATAGIVEVVDVVSSTGEGLLESLAAAVPLPAALGGGGDRLGGGEILAVIPPEWAQKLIADGWSQSDVAEYLHRHTTLPLERVPASLRGQVSVDGPLRSAMTPDDVHVITAGGVGTKAVVLPSWQGTAHPVTVPVADTGRLSAGRS